MANIIVVENDITSIVSVNQVATVVTQEYGVVIDGVPGAQGDPGVGVPNGGTTGQILAKATDTDFDTEWIDGSGVGTVTSVDTGTGLTGGPVTVAGTISLNSSSIASLALADTSLQPGDDVSDLVNDAGYLAAGDNVSELNNDAGYTTNTGTVTNVSGTAPIQVATGSSTPVVSIDAATTLAAGSMSAADKTKLNAITGTNTGDQTITLTGDVTGSGTGSFSTSLSATAVTPGSYTNLNATIGADGRITAASNGSAGGVVTFNTRSGAVTLLSADVTSALGFTPVTNARTISAGTGLTGGGDLTANRSFALSSGSIASLALADSALQSGDNVSELVNDAGYTTNTGTVTSVATGTGLTGGPVTTTGTISLNAGSIASLSLADSSVQPGDNVSDLVNDAGYAVTLDNLSDVVITLPADGDVLTFNTLSGNWINLPAGAATGVVSFNTRTGAVTLTSGDITSALAYTPATDTRLISTGTGLTGGGDLQADRTIALDSASIASLALADSSTQPGDNISTLTNDAGYTTNVGTVTNVSGTAPIVSSGGATPAISISAATTGAAGSMSASDKTKLDAITGTNTGDQTITLTGGVTGSGTGSFAATVVTNANLTGDVTSVGNATTYAGTVPINKGGTGQVTAAAAFDALAPTQTGNSGKFLTTNGTTASWGTPSGSGTVTSVDMSVPAFLSVSGNPVTSSGTLAVTLSGTALPAVNGGTAQTSYTTGDILYASASNTLSKLAIGSSTNVLTVTGGVPTWAAAAGGTSFSIGTIIQGTSAPTDSNTWLECNGAAVSQSTYATLYSNIGHSWMNFTMTNSTTVLPATFSSIAWVNSKWVSVVTSSTQTRTSTDGLSWSNAGSTSTGLSGTNLLFTDGTNVLWSNQTATTAYLSTNEGTSWSTSTLSASGVWFFGANGANWIATKANSRDIMSSNDRGATWATQTNALPASAATNYTPVLANWDGTRWSLYNNGSSGISYYTTDSTGVGSWTSTTTYFPWDGNGRIGGARNSSTVISISQATTAGYVTLTTDNGVTNAISKPMNPNVNIGNIWWNGYVFCLCSAYNPLSGAVIYVSTNGINWNQSAIAGVYSGGLSTAAATFYGANVSLTNFPVAGLSGGEMLLSQTQVTPSGNYPMKFTPSCTPASQFNLPIFPGSIKYWIRAL